MKKKEPPRRSKSDPQLRKDPVFMKNVEAALAAELRDHSSQAAPAAAPAARTEHAAHAEAAPPAPIAPIAPVAPAAGKRGKKGRTADGRESLAAELASLIPDLDAEGLAFLIEQARIHLYNMKVAELEAATQAAEKAGARRAGASGRVAPGSSPGISVQAADGGANYHIVYDGKWKFFTGEEMLALVRIAGEEGAENEASARIFRWLKTERLDVLQDFSIRSPADALPAELVALLRRTFKVRRIP